MSATTINDVRLQLGRVIVPILLIVGNFSSLFTTLILGRTLKQRMNPCVLYLFCASISNWIAIDTGLVSSLYAVVYVEPINKSNFMCKFIWYSGHVLIRASRSFLIAACVDRWAICSQNAKIRLICQPKVAYRVTIYIIISSLLIHIPILIYLDNSTGRCAINPVFNLFYTIFVFIEIGILPPLFMIVFTLLARYNLNKIRSRVRPSGVGNSQDIHINKRDHDLMKMLIGEVLVFCLTTWPYPTIIAYNYFTIPLRPYKDAVQLAIETLIGYIVQPLLTYSYCCTQFYVYAAFSKKFREDFLELIHIHQPRFSIQLTIRPTLVQIERR